MIPCGCGHVQTDDGWCEVVEGRQVHEVEHDGQVCRLCGKNVFSGVEEREQ